MASMKMGIVSQNGHYMQSWGNHGWICGLPMVCQCSDNDKPTICSFAQTSLQEGSSSSSLKKMMLCSGGYCDLLHRLEMFVAVADEQLHSAFFCSTTIIYIHFLQVVWHWALPAITWPLEGKSSKHICSTKIQCFILERLCMSYI